MNLETTLFVLLAAVVVFGVAGWLARRAR